MKMNAVIIFCIFSCATAVLASGIPNTRGFREAPSCTCGKVNRVNRIAGGKDTEVNEYPWHVGLVASDAEDEPTPFCGGTLICDRWILTAYHCIQCADIGDFDIVLGDHDWSTQSETNSYRRQVKQIVFHPETGSFSNFDLALVEFNDPIDFSDPKYDHIRPACLPQDDVPVGADVIATGWGFQSITCDGFQPNKLQEVTVQTISNEQCNYQYANLVRDSMLCAMVEGGGKDTCNGDDGGPLVWQDKNSYVLVGTTSFGNKCALPDFAGVYARVHLAKDWIIATACDQSTCQRNDATSITNS